MGNLEALWAQSVDRRKAFRHLAAFLAGSTILKGQLDPWRDHSRVPGLKELRDVFDFEAVAYARLPRTAYDFTAYGSDSEFTLRRNREAFDWVQIVTRNGGSTAAGINTETTLFGQKMAYPIFVAPSSGHGALHPDGELATHKGASAASNTTMIVSNGASSGMDKIAAVAPSPLWFQLYPRQSKEENLEQIERALAAGASGVCVTIDQVISVAPYERSQHLRNLGGRGGPAAGRGAPQRAQARPPARGPYGVNPNRLFYEWKMFDELRPNVKVPLLAKGVLTAEAAKKAVDAGLDGVYVSNHGGRSMDYGPSSLEQLPEIVEAVGGKVPIIFDSGIRRGSDIFKALALGANAVSLGRSVRWGLGAYGPEGVQKVIEILQTELKQSMAAAGRMTLASIDKTAVRTDFP